MNVADSIFKGFCSLRFWCIVVLGSTLGCPGCPPTSFSTGELRFLQRGNVVRTESMAGPRTVSFSELGPVPLMPLLDVINPLSSIDLSGVNVSLEPVNNQGLPGPQIEAHLFVDDLNNTNDYLRFVAAASPVQQWDARAAVNHRGFSLAVPFPPNPGWNRSQRFPVGPPMLPVWFWGPHEPAESALNADGLASVKSVRFYRPGLCSTEIAFTQADNRGIFDQVSDTLFQRFAARELFDRGSPVRAYSRASVLLDDGVDAFGPNGGFLLFFWYRAAVAGGLQTINFAANYEYAFTLVDGRLRVIPKRNDLLVQPQQNFTDFRDALETTLPQAIAESFDEQQRAPQPARPGAVETAMECNPQDPASTRLGRELFKTAAIEGGARLGLTPSERDMLGAAIENPNNWHCGSDNRARFILRAKRINVYGDAIELVWFDKAEVSDPMFALYAAAVSQGQAASLCSRPRTIVGEGRQLPFRTRPLVSVVR